MKTSIKPEQIFTPQPMYVIGTTDSNRNPNFCVITWIEFGWNGSPYIVMGLGGKKKTKDNIMETKEFTANLVSQEILKLADYFGCTSGTDGAKDKLKYSVKKGEKVEAPILEDSKWIFECKVERVIELDGSHLFISKIVNIQIDKELEGMDREKIDLTRINPVIYSPYGYFSIDKKLGECGDWEKM